MKMRLSPEQMRDNAMSASGSIAAVVLACMARPEGFEPSCHRLEDGCLNPLGYGRVNLVVPTSGIEPLASSLPWMRSAH